MTSIKGAVVLVTGGGRGLGAAIVDAAYDRGAAKVYATARDPRTIRHPDAVPLTLEVTDDASAAALAVAAPDVTVLVNNAGAYRGVPLLAGDLADVRAEFDTNFYGPLRVTRALAPVIAANGGGHVLNVASVLSWVALGGSYSASKAALWSASNALRAELSPLGIGVTSLHVGYMDTDMAADVTAPKADPREVADLALDGVEAGQYEVLADDTTRFVKAALSGDAEKLYSRLAG
jgi:NAD(P)-dependent dehydrogenase (short-subunit alcohol dehydrogenase family)